MSVSRNTLVVVSVLVFHLLLLWALQNGLLRRAVEIIVPAEILSRMIEPAPPAPKAEPPKPLPQVRAKTPPPPPLPLAIQDPTPALAAPAGVVQPPPEPPAPIVPVVVAPPAPPRIELPSSDADYLRNPPPAYPPISRRLGEQGKVLVRVFIGPDGAAQRGEVRQSSGYERLDQTALAAVLKWRYVPGKRNGVPEGMWFNVPINFILEQ